MQGADGSSSLPRVGCTVVRRLRRRKPRIREPASAGLGVPARGFSRPAGGVAWRVRVPHAAAVRRTPAASATTTAAADRGPNHAAHPSASAWPRPRGPP